MKLIDSKFYTFYIDIIKKFIDGTLDIQEIHLFGSRWCGKTFNTEKITTYLAYKTHCDVFAFRKEEQDARKELNVEYRDCIDSLRIPYKTRFDTFEFERTHSKIRTLGLNAKSGGKKIQKTGLARSQAPRIIKFFEERDEFSKKDINQVDEAVRSDNPNCKFLTICCSNPNVKTNEYVRWHTTLLPENEVELLDKGYQYQLKDVIYEGGVKVKCLLMRVNWRVIQKELTEEQLMALKIKIAKSYKNNYIRGRVVDLGIAGSEETTIYGALLGNIKPEEYIFHERVGGGGDIGLGTAKGSGITAFGFAGTDRYGAIDIYDEITFDNKEQYCDPQKQYSKIVDFYIRN